MEKVDNEVGQTDILKEDEEPVETLIPRAIFGINGKVASGMYISPDGKKLIFPIGSKIALVDNKTNSQEFLSGHSNDVSCIDLSSSSKYLASGQINHMGYRAHVILWDYENRKEIARHDLHKVRVQSVCFTAQDKYVISIGGEDDGTVIVFDVESLSPICRSQAARDISGVALKVRALYHNSSFFVVCGDAHLRLWSILRDQKKLLVHDVNIGRCQRRYTCMRIDANDHFVYMGTMTGDIVKVILNCCDTMNVTKPGYSASLVGSYGVHLPRKPLGQDCARYVNGIRDLCIVGDGMLLIGAGDGCIELVEERKLLDGSFKNYPNPTWPMLASIRKCRLHGSISGMVPINTLEYFVCTDQNEIYKLNIKTFKLKLLKTCHLETVNSIIFPRNMSSVFATAGYETIRIWSVGRLQELLRIIVYNFQCAAILFTSDGSSILSVWNDGIIRAFTPITGRLIYSIPNAHNKGCSAITATSNGRLLITGGVEGQVRIWKIEPTRQSLVKVLKDHSGPITSLDINAAETEVISSSSDGSCVIWDVKLLTRKRVMRANTQFMCGKFFPTAVQILTCGSDGVLSYWMVYNGSLIRDLEGSRKSSVNWLAISNAGSHFITVGNDQFVKIWDYNKGIVVASGNEHASAVKSVAIAPSGKFFVTGSTDGSVIIWNMPKQFWDQSVIPPMLLPRLSSDSLGSDSSSKASVTSQTRVTPKENISEILAKSPKDEVCCIECPPIDKRKMPDQGSCGDIVPNITKC